MVGRSVIVSAVRTPFGKLNGGLAPYPATELGAIAIRAGLERVGLEGREVDYVIMGQVLQAGAGQAPARQAAVGAGIPVDVPSDTVNKVCASSIRAVEIADSMIRAGDVELVVTGGMESMTNAPYALPKARKGYRMGDGTLVDLMIWDGLRSTFDELHMVQQAAKVARELGISREDQDAWALRSHERAAAAQDAGRFDDEIVPVGEVTADESVRRDSTFEKLATIVSQGYVADEVAWLARTPANAGRQALEKAGKSIGDVERVEVNEAFSSVALNSVAMLGADPETANVNGGAVALGHPIGASGGRILGTMVHDLRRNGGGLGLAAICSGGGQGDALLIEV